MPAGIPAGIFMMEEVLPEFPVYKKSGRQDPGPCPLEKIRESLIM